MPSTWRGEPGEEWSSAQGLHSILISIQSLMSPNPYENEPGFEDAKSDYDKKNQEAYAAKIRHETLRISVIQRLEEYLGISRVGDKLPSVSLGESDIDNFRDDVAFEPFQDKCKIRFLWYYDSYLQTVIEGGKKYKDNTKFEKMPFEGGGNIMEGSFNYTDLQNRLAKVKKELEKETESWAEQGKVALQKEQSIATNVQRQYEQCKEAFKMKDAVMVDIEQVDENPFVWDITLYGRAMTNLDGGVFKIRMHISPRFPTEQPRVKVLTPLFHHRVSKDGQLCYLINNSDNLCAHVEATIAAIDDDNPAFDPRTRVHPEAASLLWGKPDQRKQYTRRLRRSVQDSTDYI